MSDPELDIPIEPEKPPVEPTDSLLVLSLILGVMLALASWFTVRESIWVQLLVVATMLFGAILFGAMRKDQRKAVTTAAMLAWPGFSVSLLLIAANLFLGWKATWASDLFRITLLEMVLTPGVAYGVHRLVAKE